MNAYDLVIVGGGPAGMMSAITAAENGNEVTIIEKMPSFGKKLLITGKGNETVQYVKGKYVPCETDVEYAKKYLKELDENKK